MNEKRLGKIGRIQLGYGGYQDAMLGLTVVLEGSGWGCCDFKGFWMGSIEVDAYTKWTENDRQRQYADVMYFIDSLLVDAKKTTLESLNGIPVEVEFDGFSLVSWRILKEVL